MDKIKELFERFVAYLKEKPAVSVALAGAGLFVALWAFKRAKRRAQQRRAAARARRGKKRKGRK